MLDVGGGSGACRVLVGKPEGTETRPTCRWDNTKKDLKNYVARHGLDWACLKIGTCGRP
jgi:hypothetical protein